MEQPEVLSRSFTAPVNNLDGMVPSPKTPTPTSIRKAWLAVTTPKTWSTVTSRIWEILSEATIRIVRTTRPTVTDGVVRLYRVICIPSMKWEGALVISCIALSLDPLFLYIPIIDEKNKCLAVDKKLTTIALGLRLFTDIHLTVHFIAQICGAVDTDHPNLSDSDYDNFNLDSGSDSDSETTSCLQNSVKKSKARRMPWLSVLINFLAILPIPQVAIIVGFFRLRGSSGTEFFLRRTIINIFLVLQYLPRFCQIFISSQHFRMGGIWIKPSLNFFLYILASHVFAAFWYFFAIERETSCWYQVCRNTPGCEDTFDCNAAGSSSINMTVLDQLCPINTPNATVFDFGIYLPVLQSGNTGSVNFLTKLLYSLWWGLKNLSNFGTNLETSSYMWENCFAILICLSGLLLFMYLIGNMQKYMELATDNFLDAEKSRKSKIKAKRVQIKAWMSSNCVSVNLKKKIKKYINQYNIVQKNIMADVDVIYFLHDYGFAYNHIRESLLENLVQRAVKKVPMLQKMDENGLKSLCEYMKPVIYKESESIVKETDHQLDQMIFIIQGEIECTNKSMISQPNPLEKGDYFGEEIETWASLNYMRSYYDPLPPSPGRVRCLKKVEAFALKAFDLLTFAQQNLNQSNINPAQLEKLALDHHNTLHPTRYMHPMERWKCPEHGWVKLNVSAVWNPASKQAVMGCVCRDERGAFMIAGTNGALSPFRDAFLAEASSIVWAIDFCQQHVKLKAGIGIVVESDNQDLIDCLNGPSLATNERISKILLPILENIVSMASKDLPITYLHCNRQNNTAAQCVANHGYRAVGDPNGSIWLSVPPNWLISSLKEDSRLLCIEHDLELGRNNDFEETSPPNGVPDAEDIFTLLAEESQV